MRKPQLLDTVKLTRDWPEHGVSAGQIGAIVEDATTIAVFALPREEFEVVVPWVTPVPEKAAP